MECRRLSAFAVLGAAALLVGCGGPDGTEAYGCGECPAAYLDVTDQAVWVVQGTRLHRLDPATGRVEWSRQVARRTPSGSADLWAVSAAPDGIWVAWHRGAILVPGRTGRLTRIGIEPAGAVPTLATAQGRTWLGLGRRVIALHADGVATPVIRFEALARLQSAPAAILVHSGRRTTLLDPRSGARLAGAILSRRASWRVDPRKQTVTHLDPATGAATGPPLHVHGVFDVIETPGGDGYARTRDPAVARLGADGPRLVWRTGIPH
jgi:hypothetical protein